MISLISGLLPYGKRKKVKLVDNTKEHTKRSTCLRQRKGNYESNNQYSAPRLGPRSHYAKFCLLAKKSVNKKPFPLRTIFFTYQHFSSINQASKMPSRKFEGLQFFVGEKFLCSLTTILKVMLHETIRSYDF